MMTRKELTLHIEEFHAIPKFNQSLESPEEIEKWISERKRKYPTEKNIQLKKDSKEVLKDLDAKKTCEKPKKSKKSTCKFYANGTCKKGDQCKFAHTSPTDSLLENVFKEDLNHQRKLLLEFINHVVSLGILYE